MVKRPPSKQLTVLLLAVLYPYLHCAVLLHFYYGVDVGLLRFGMLCVVMEYAALVLYGLTTTVLVFWINHAANRRIQTFARVLATLMLLSLGFIRAVQTTSIVQSRYYLGRDVFEHAGMIEFVFTFANITIFLSTLAVPLVCVWLLWWRRETEHRLSGRFLGWFVAALLLVYIGSLQADGYRRFYFRYSGEFGLSRNPELSFFKVALWSSSFQTDKQPTLAPETIKALAGFGIEFNPDAELPFARHSVYPEAARAPWPPFDKDPDIVIVFVESLSAKLLGCYGSRWQGITPYVDELAAHSLLFTNYYNHTSPTVTGIHGSLCSAYEVAGHASWDSENAELLPRTKVLSLAHVLKARGYQTTYFGCGSEFDAHLGEAMRKMGFERVLFKRDILKAYPLIQEQFHKDYPHFQSRRYLSDFFMLRVTRHAMELVTDQPRLICVSTIGTHFPYDYGEGVKYRDGKVPILNSLATLDKALAENMAFLDAPTRKRDVLLVLTADHAMFPTVEHIAIRDKDYNKKYYDRIALLITRSGSPRGRVIDTVGSSVDLTPTLLHLLRINVANPFMGRSLFVPGRVPNLLGSQARHLFVRTARQELAFSVDELASWEGVAVGDARFGHREFRQWLSYLSYLWASNRIWRR